MMLVQRHEPSLEDVARHYDEIDPYYRELWGEHLHHGLWVTGDESPERAVRQLVDLVVERAAIGAGESVCDVGCGYGATARVLAREYGALVTGYTVSRAQYDVARANAGREPNPCYVLGDWLRNDAVPESFDALIAIESTEHMVSKRRFFSEAFRVLRPGGRLVVCAWLSSDAASRWQVRHLLEPICREGRLAGLGTESDYQMWLESAGFGGVGREDLSWEVRRTWNHCLTSLARRLVTKRSSWSYLLDPRNTNRAFALAVLRIWLAYRTHCLRYVVFVAQRSGRE